MFLLAFKNGKRDNLDTLKNLRCVFRMTAELKVRIKFGHYKQVSLVWM